jgi:DNA-binding transcriptional ArsR family regulator
MSEDERSTQGRTVRPGQPGADADGRGAAAPGPEPAADQAGDPPLRFEDPRTIRALAHPARLAIIDALASGDELTATDCASLTGLTPSATAYHLKLLQRFGFAEPAPPRPDGRQRPWRATGRRTKVELDDSTPAGAAATSAVIAALLDTTRAVAVEFTESSHAEPAGWRDSGSLSNADFWLTADEVAAVGEQLAAVLEPYRDRALTDNRPEGSRRVRVLNLVVPHRQRPAGSGGSRPRPVPASDRPGPAAGARTTRAGIAEDQPGPVVTVPGAGPGR